MKLYQSAVFALGAVAGAFGQTSSWVRVEHADAAALAAQLESQGFDVIEGSVLANSVDLVVDARSREMLERQGYTLRWIADGKPQAEVQRGAGTDAVPPGYPSGAQIQAQLAAAAANFASICQLVDLTSRYGLPATVEGRHLFALKISDNVAADEDEPNVLILAGTHCRELGTHVVALDTISRLTTQYGIDPTITALVDSNEIWVVANANPDGYEYVFNVDNLWRKNRHVFAQGVGVDLNRNYPFGWSSPCAGSTIVADDTYKGPSAASEAEVRTILALHDERRFAKVLDYHSFGSETLWGYLCWTHPWSAMLQQSAISISLADGYGPAERPPSAHGEEWQYPLAFQGSFAFLTEIGNQFQPSYASSVAEANQVWGGTQWLLQRPLSIVGHVVAASGGAPISGAKIDYPNVAFAHGETNSSFGPFARYHAVLPTGTTTLRFSAPGYLPQSIAVNATSASSLVLDVPLESANGVAVYCTAKANSLGCTPQITSTGTPSATATIGFRVLASPVLNNKAGLFFYGVNGQQSVPFQGGLLCVKTPIHRTFLQNSGGNPPPSDCSGSFSLDFNAYIATGLDPSLVVGQSIDGQYWSRDPGFAPPNNTSLSDGLHFVIGP